MTRTVRLSLLVLLFIVLVLPFIAFTVNAFARQWFYPQFIPQTWSLQAWERLFSARSNVPEALFNSTVIAAGVTVVSVAIGLPAARILGLKQFRGKWLVELLVFLPRMVPPIAVGLGLSVNFLRLGLGGTLLGVGLVHLIPVMPYVVLTLSGVFANYDADYEAQARTLGANNWAVLRHITIPAVLPGVAVAGMFAFLISWSQYILTLLIGGGQVLTLPILLFSSAGGGNNAEVAVQALLLVGPTLLVLVLASRYLSTFGAFGRA